MGDKSTIEWTDATWNPVRGCTKVSPGCEHRYAETLFKFRLEESVGYLHAGG
jgi:protein gp37